MAWLLAASFIRLVGLELLAASFIRLVVSHLATAHRKLTASACRLSIAVSRQDVSRLAVYTDMSD